MNEQIIGGRKCAVYPAINDGYDHHSRGDGTYDLTIKEGVPTVTHYSSEQAPAWTLSVFSPDPENGLQLDEDEIRSGNWSPDYAYLILGDMGYHSIPIAAIRPETVADLARDYDETGAEDEIREMLETYLAFQSRDPGRRKKERNER